MYLHNTTLAENLLQVSALATGHLQRGVDPKILFGDMHSCDFPKFYETMSHFAIAARVNGNAEQEAEFLAGVRACGPHLARYKLSQEAVLSLESRTVKAVLHEGDPDVARALP